MADINTGGGEQKKGKPKKISLRVDFTPMVDMNMLLITFFMFCTTLSKPQMMDLVVPVKDDKVLTPEERTQSEREKTITLLLAENDVIYYYFGKPTDVDALLLKTNYSPDGLRELLVSRSGRVVSKMRELRELKYQKKISDEDFSTRSKDIKKEGLTIIIKPVDGSTYKNFVDVLDEMQICSIKLYAIADVTDDDNRLMENFLNAGRVAQ